MKLIRDLLLQWNISIEDYQINQFDKYYSLLLEWNQKINLTNIIEKEDVIVKHFLDSSAMLRYVDISDKSLIDVGTGAGFPGLVLKILCPSCNVTLMDSLNKRLLFLDEVIKELSLDGIKTVHGRAEDFAHNSLYRESFDIVTSRAVANLSTLSEYCIPFAKKGGIFIPYKSGNIEEEILSSERALNILDSYIDIVERFTLPNSDYDRSLLFIRKNGSTKKQYPRKAGTPAKMPL